MRICGVSLSRSQLGWNATVFFWYPTAGQFTDVYADVSVLSTRWYVAIYRALRDARRIARENAPKPGEREAKGWN